MKKSFISIVLCVALLMSSLCVMFAMPASAASARDFLTEGIITNLSDGATAEFVDGKFVFTATAAGQEVALYFEEEASMHDVPFWRLKMESDIPWVGGLYNANDGKWMWSNSDWCYDFANGDGASNPTKAGSEDLQLRVTGCYTWTGAPLPEYAAVKQVVFIAHGAGTITVEECAMVDGLENYDLNTASYNAEDEWDNTVSLLGAADAWTSKNVNGSDVVVTEKGDALVFSNTAGAWPSAYINFETPYVVNADAAVINADFTAKQSTTVYLYLNGKTADLSGYDAVDYVAIMPAGTSNPELGTGNYAGVQYLKDILPEGAVDADGNVEISAIAVFAIGGAGADCAVVRTLDLAYDNVETTTTETTTTTTVPAGPYVTYTVETVTHQGSIAADEEITLNVTASEAADVNGVQFNINFDDAKFEFVNYELAGVLADFDAADNKYVLVSADKEAVDGVKSVVVTAMVIANDENLYDIAADEVILKVTLKAKEAITENVDVLLANAEVTSNASINGGFELVADVVNGGIVIEAPAIKKGDINGNGQIQMNDAMQAFYHVAKKLTLTGEKFEAADVNSNGQIQMNDAMKIFYFVAKKIDSVV